MKRYDNNIIMCFGDLHAPYQHPKALSFIKEVVDYYQPDRVFNLGDLLDIYNVSDYPKDLDHPDNWKLEFKKGREVIRELASILPEQCIVESNHGERIYKRARVSGIPREFLV